MILIAGLIAVPVLLLQWHQSAIWFGDGVARMAQPLGMARPDQVAAMAPSRLQ